MENEEIKENANEAAEPEEVLETVQEASPDVSAGDAVVSGLPDAGGTNTQLPSAVLPSVSGSDLLPVLESPCMVQAETLADADAVAALAESAASIDLKLSILLFLLLFIWCERKIRASVYKMTGRREDF